MDYVAIIASCDFWWSSICSILQAPVPCILATWPAQLLQQSIKKKKVNLKSSLSTQYRMSGAKAPFNLNLSTRRSLAVNFTPRSHHTRGNSPDTNWTGVWVGPPCRSGCFEEKSSAPARIRTLYCLDRSLVSNHYAIYVKICQKPQRSLQLS